MEQVSKERIKYLRESKNFVKPILQILQDNGGELSGFAQIDKLISQYTDISDAEINYSKISEKGNKYTPYYFGRNFAVKNLEIAGFLTHPKNAPIILTQKGLDTDLSKLNVEKDVYSITKQYWEKKKEEAKERRKTKNLNNDTSEQSKDDITNIYEDEQEWRESILDKVKSLEAFRFESFCRGLLNKMGFEIDTIKGITKSNDGGIDGFGYCLDNQSLKTTRVAIQCKKYTDSPVGSPEINNLRGAIDTHRAEYGIFITTSYFSSEAIKSSREGGTPITLISGNDLVDLMVKYKYKVQEIPVYAPDEEYFDS